VTRLIKGGAAMVIIAAAMVWKWEDVERAWARHQIRRHGLKGHFQFAESLCQQWLRKNPQDPEFHELAGFLAVRQGDLARGTASYAQAVACGLNPSRALDHLAFGRAFPQALVEFRHLTQIRPRDPEGWYGLGLSWHGTGNVLKALEAYKSALYKQPDHPAYRHMLEKALQDRRRGRMTYVVDRSGEEPLAQWGFADQSSLYIRGYHLAHVLGYHHPRFGAKGLAGIWRDRLPGCHLTTTIDLDLQTLAEQVFDQGSRGGRGSLILLDPRTGEILALVNRPTFNANRLEKDWDRLVTHKREPLRTRATESLYEPGSVAKIMTAAAWLETSPPPPAPWPLDCHGALWFQRQRLWDWQPHGVIHSLTEAMDVSCNVAFGRVGVHLGPHVLRARAEAFGFNAAIPFDLPVTPSVFPEPGGGERQTAALACGLGEGFLMTPMQAAMILAAVANDGVIMKPTLVKAVHGVDGRVIRKWQPEVWRRAMKRETARQLRDILVHGVQHGISQKAGVEGLSVGGKTGTSGSSKMGLHAWFGALAPAEAPAYVVLIMVEHGGTGMHTAAPIARRLFAKMREQGYFNRHP